MGRHSCSDFSTSVAHRYANIALQLECDQQKFSNATTTRWPFDNNLFNPNSVSLENVCFNQRFHIWIKMFTLLDKWAISWNYYSVVSTLIISKQTELNLLQNPLFYILIWTKETFWTFLFSSCEYDFICLNIFFIGASLTFYSSLPFYESIVEPYVRMAFAYNNLSLTQCYIMCFILLWICIPNALIADAKAPGLDWSGCKLLKKSFFFYFCPQDEKNQVLMTNAWLQLVSQSLRRSC